jgi:predicted nucleic acid-binding protein
MANNPFLQQADMPLCFDTSAIYGNVEGARLLQKVRDQFPRRELIIPAWVVAEKLRHMRQRMGANFRMSLVESFLSDQDLRLRVVSFSLKTATDAWLGVVKNFTDDEWRWERLPKEYTPRPCAQRCRTGDHIVYAVAREHRALLVTRDDGFIAQVQRDVYLPGAVHIQELQSMLSPGT